MCHWLNVAKCGRCIFKVLSCGLYWLYGDCTWFAKTSNVSQNELIDQFGFTKTDLGQIGFWFSVTYGIGKTVVGYLGDGRNTKNFVSLLLIFAALSMFAFAGVTGSLSGMIFFFALNGVFQSAGGPLSYSTITKWTVHKNSRSLFRSMEYFT